MLNFPCTKGINILLFWLNETRVVGKLAGACPSPLSVIVMVGRAGERWPEKTTCTESFAIRVRSVGVSSARRHPWYLEVACGSFKHRLRRTRVDWQVTGCMRVLH